MVLDPLDESRLQKIREELELEYKKPISQKELDQHLPGVMVRRSALIHLTKLNGQPFVLNPELIETIEATPDTVISLVNGRKYLVKESVDQVTQACIDYKRSYILDK